jgi:hypothetical protein
MRRLLAVVVLSLFAVLAVPSLALASHSNGQGPAQDFISGSAKGVIAGVPSACIPNNGHFEANAQASFEVGPSGAGPNAQPGGHFFTTINFAPTGGCLGFTDIAFDGSIICVNSYLSPNSNAVWRGIVENVLFEPGDVPGIPGLLFAGDTVLSRHVDNDGPFGSPGAPDEDIGFRQPPGQTSCPQAPFATLPITQGNLVVHDGQ